MAIVKIFFGDQSFEILGEFLESDGVLTINRTHIQGAGPGLLGHKALYDIAEQARVKYGYRQIIIYGSRRTSGKRNGKISRKITFK